MVKKIPAVVERAAKAAFPNEACGLVVKRGKRSVWVECPNTHTSPEKQFRIDPSDYTRIADTGEIVGVWHTHPRGEAWASEADKVGCELSELPWYIFPLYETPADIVFGDTVFMRPSGFVMPYIERPYVYGVFDCYSLAQDYYAREFGIELANTFPRIEEWWKHGHNFFVEGFEGVGLVRLVNRTPEVGDLFLIQTDGTVPNHVAVYIGNDMIMHHCHGRMSRRDIYGGYWAKHTTHHLRHKTKC